MIFTRKDNQTQGRWTKQEHTKFLFALQIYGKDWKKIQEYIKTRNGAQIRSHAQKYFLKINKPIYLEDSNREDKILVPVHENQQLQDASSKQLEKEKNHSYFVKTILKLSNEIVEFDLWKTLIDQKTCQDNNDIETRIQQRKGSFSTFYNEENDVQEVQKFQPEKKIQIE